MFFYEAESPLSGVGDSRFESRFPDCYWTGCILSAAPPFFLRNVIIQRFCVYERLCYTVCMSKNNDKSIVLIKKSDGSEVARFATMGELASYAMDDHNETGEGYEVRNEDPKYVNTVGHSVTQ